MNGTFRSLSALAIAFSMSTAAAPAYAEGKAKAKAKGKQNEKEEHGRTTDDLPYGLEKGGKKPSSRTKSKRGPNQVR